MENNEDDVLLKIKLKKTIDQVIEEVKDEIIEEIVEMPKTGQTRIIYIACAIIAGVCIVIIVWKKKKASKK